ncbi:glycosyltransferase family 4 protein [Desulfosporosinus sp. OT]|uniref:glycosyltransferase family 4 protein n=1 Tax=Desulfosporosinus sp. OT TaxID=913865 RepID=UPI000223A932|nr:glycosyltransferase family 4 protein [Desulfosporosinus sp. OT]EGW38468.1 glycosyl transferases group 1 family protein [Desulfosporosinus sp. OT]
MEVLVWETSHLIGGGQQMSLAIAKMLKKKYKVKFLIPQRGPLSKQLEREGIPYICCGSQILPIGIKKRTAIFKYSWMSIKAMLKFLHIYMIHKPDIIYVPGPAALPWGAICGKLVRRPVIWHLHHIFEDGGTKKLLNYFSNWSSIKTIICISDSVGSQLTSEKIKDKVVTMYNPVDSHKYKSGKASRIYKELSLTPGQQILIGHIGILQPSKRQEFVIQVVIEILKRGYSVQALLVGSARKETREYERELKRLVTNLNLEKNIHFMGQRQDVADILAAIDVVIIPSVEGLSLVGLEALAAGKPIVCNEVGGACELAEVSKGGICFSDSVVMAANAILEVLTPETKQKLYSNAVCFIEQQSYERYQMLLLRHFERALR